MNKFNFNKRKAIQVALSTLAIERLNKKQEYTNKKKKPARTAMKNINKDFI